MASLNRSECKVQKTIILLYFSPEVKHYTESETSIAV